MKIAVAQVPSEKGNVDANILTHIEAIEKAVSEGVSYIVFPELSLTGYELELAADLAFTLNDERLEPLRTSARKNNIYIGVGLPWIVSDSLKIGFFLFLPNGEIKPYGKIHLHSGEDKYFTPGESYLVEDIENERIANAICADTNHVEHAGACAEKGASIYIAGVLLNEKAYEIDSVDLAEYARNFDMVVAIANHSNATGGYQPVGKSSIWSKSGLLAIVEGTQKALVIAEEINNEWVGEVVEI